MAEFSRQRSFGVKPDVYSTNPLLCSSSSATIISPGTETMQSDSGDIVPITVISNNNVRRVDGAVNVPHEQQKQQQPRRQRHHQPPLSAADTRAASGPQNGLDSSYVDRLRGHYDYSSPIVANDSSKPKQQQRPRANPAARAPPVMPLPPPPPPPPLRATYKSEPLMTHHGAAAAGASAEEIANLRNSYSQTLENALFYSQAIRKIRETDCVDASDPYAVAVPRSRPGKDDIRQRRARNVIASREVFSITTPSAFIPLPSSAHGGMWALDAMPKLPSIERSRAMRSDSAIRKPATSSSLSLGKQGAAEMQSSSSSSSSAAAATTGFFGEGCNSVGRRHGNAAGGAQESAWEAARRAGIDQPVPSEELFFQELNQRALGSPRNVASSVITSRSMQLRHRRPYSTAESGVLGSDDDDDDENDGFGGGERSRTMKSHQHPHRLSVASHFSAASGYDQRQSNRPQEQLQGRRRHVSSHSRQVATRLLMRAGFSSIAIRVARLGKSAQPALGMGLTRDYGALDSTTGVDLDPNGLQTLRAERRKQVKRIDEYGFLQFEGDDERPSEYALHYEAWRKARNRASGEPVMAMTGGSLAPGSETKWETLLRSFDGVTLRGSRKVKQLVQAGVPGRLRGQVYYVLSGAASLERSGEYARLVAADPLPIYDVIERDVARCYPDHRQFADVDGVGQRQLRRILRAYAQYNSALGYCQGMGRLVGLFLIVGMSEEQAFWVLAATIRKYIPGYYDADLGGLRIHTAVFETLLGERNPRLHQHLAEQGCDALMYATPWFMTVFTLSLPWPAALRVWDWFMFRGAKVLFRVALAITDLASKYLLEACPSITELLGFLLHIPHSLVDADALIAAAARVKISERHIDRLTARLSPSGTHVAKG